jgi:HK97 family phage major capsid protein
MLNLTKRVKAHMVEHCGVDAEASDEVFRKVAGQEFAKESDSKFTVAQYVKFQSPEEGDDGNGGNDGGETDPQDKTLELLKTISTRLDKIEAKDAPGTGLSHGSRPDGSSYEPTKDSEPTHTKSRFEQLMAGASLDNTEGAMLSARGANDQYSKDKTAAHFPTETQSGTKHAFAGQRAFEGGLGKQRHLDHSSDLEKAINGAYSKFLIQSSLGQSCPPRLKCTEHEMELVQYALGKCKWAGVINGDCAGQPGTIEVKNRFLKQHEIKSILDDAVSGGLEITPIFFDDAVILTPILFGEFAPRVNMVPITRGRRIEGGAISNVSLGASTEGTAITLFNTAGFIAAFDTTIFVVAGAIEIGLDEMSDSPIDIGGIVTGQYGRKLLEWLDNVITDGDGATQPEGIMQAAGTTLVNFAGVAATIGGYESLLFGISKKYKAGYDRSRICFGGTELSYQRARSIAVGPGDSRRLFGLNQENYMMFGHNYGVSEQMANTEIFFANLGRYRMYRRMGLTFRVTTEGKDLTLRNEMLISCRARFGGQLEDGAAAAVVRDAEA